ncbi:MAG: pyrroline-5-carboxylate reductase [Pseudomonadota bacterium]
MTNAKLSTAFKAGPLVLVGAGKMGGAMLAGLLKQGLNAEDIRVQDPAPPSEMVGVLAKHGITAQGAPLNLSKPASVVLLAVKPQIMETVLPTVRDLVGPGTLVISVAAGKPLDLYENALSPNTAIIRAMPNTPAAIGRGITGLFANASVSASQRDLCADILATLGHVVWLDSEDQMDALTAVSGSGPAYVFHMVEALAQAGVDAGLSEVMAMQLARNTITGAAALLDAESETPAAQLRENVTSPGGTTQAALEVLMRDPNGLTDLMTQTVKAAAARSREMAQG